MHSYLLETDADLYRMLDLLARGPQPPPVVDFDENLALASVWATTRLWQDAERLLGFAYLDDFNNLWFALDPDVPAASLAAEMVAWGVSCMQARNAATGRNDALDTVCSATDALRLAALEANGFVRASVRTLHYARALSAPVAEHAFPPGFSFRPVQGEAEVERLVALHRAAFGTDHMTVEQRLAMMRAPAYAPELDLVAVAPDGDLAAFCACGFSEDREQVGYTDPIGTHPRYQKLGLGRALVTAGLRALQTWGAQVAELGTSSENTAMQRPAAALGFAVVSEKVWLSKEV